MNQGGAQEEKDKEEEVPQAPQLKSRPSFKGIIQWIKFSVTSARE
jgi:hypothetical protein